jgi:hypothetical protein
LNADKALPFDEQVSGQLFSTSWRYVSHHLQMVTAAEALDQPHSRGVSHGDIRAAIVIFGSQGCFPMRFVNFGAADLFSGDEITREPANGAFHLDTIELPRLLVEYFGISPGVARPLLRAIPHRGVIIKFIEVWEIHLTYKE